MHFQTISDLINSSAWGKLFTKFLFNTDSNSSQFWVNKHCHIILTIFFEDTQCKFAYSKSSKHINSLKNMVVVELLVSFQLF